MRMFHKTGILLLALLLLGTGSAVIADESVLLGRQIGHLDLSGKTIGEIAAQLAARSCLPLALESLDPASSAPFDRSGASASKEISLVLAPDTAVASALDAAVAQDPRYEWTVANGWLHVRPRVRSADSILDKPFVGSLPSDGDALEQLDQIWGGHSPAGWKTLAVVRYRSGREKKVDLAPVPANMTLRDAIDIVLWRTGALGWFTRPIVNSEGQTTGTAMRILL